MRSSDAARKPTTARAWVLLGGLPVGRRPRSLDVFTQSGGPPPMSKLSKGLTRVIFAHLGNPPARVGVIGPEELCAALDEAGYETVVKGEFVELDAIVADGPSEEAIEAAAGALRGGGRLVVLDRGLRRPPLETRTFALARSGFVEVGQANVWGASLTTGTRLDVGPAQK